MQKYFYDNSNYIECGIDEAGRGPLFGYVYAAAVIWPTNLEPDIKLIIDSKKLSKKKRKLAFDWIKTNIPNIGVGYATNQEIDTINILEATKLAMDRAINNLTIKPTHIIIDGTGWEKKFKENVKSIVKGDDKYYSIAAASIVAKEYHDMHIREIIESNEKYKLYDLENNMGYGTKKHMEALKNHGKTDFHRITFCKS